MIVAIFHCDPSQTWRYRVPGVERVVTFNAGAGSAAYAGLASSHRATYGGVRLGLCRALGVEDLREVCVVSFSAGYGYVRELLRERPDDLAAYVALDSVHATEVRGAPLPEHVAPFAWLASRAARGECVMCMGASDVDPIVYSSTREVVDAVAREVGVELRSVNSLTPVVAEARRGQLLLRYYDADPKGAGAAEHGRALTVWGPKLVALAVTMHTATLGPSAAPPTEPVPDTAPAAPPWDRPAPVRCQPAQRARLVDVSRYQGDGARNDWRAWRAKWVVGGFARVSSGANRDPTYDANARGMADAGVILRGAYTWHDPRRSVKEHLDAIRQLERGVVWAIDVEPWPSKAGATKAETAALARSTLDTWAGLTKPSELRELCLRVRDMTQAPVGCYTAGWAWRWGDLLAREGIFSWVADASGMALRAGWPVHPPGGWTGVDGIEGWSPGDWTIWQRGTIALPGEPGPVDDDVFCGDEQALAAWVRGA